MELSRNRSNDREVFVSHANAALTPKARLELGKLIVDVGWSVSAAADFYRVSWPTAKRWADRYQLLSQAQPVPVHSSQLRDRSSRPLRTPSPRKAPPRSALDPAPGIS